MSRAIWIISIVVWLLVVGFLAAIAEGFIPKTLRQLLLVLFLIGPLLLFGEGIAELVFQVIAYSVGRFLLPIITFGRLRAERSNDFLSFPWHGVARAADGKYVACADATAIFGLIFIVLAIVVAITSYALVT